MGTEFFCVLFFGWKVEKSNWKALQRELVQHRKKLDSSIPAGSGPVEESDDEFQNFESASISAGIEAGIDGFDKFEVSIDGPNGTKYWFDIGMVDYRERQYYYGITMSSFREDDIRAILNWRQDPQYEAIRLRARMFGIMDDSLPMITKYKGFEK